MTVATTELEIYRGENKIWTCTVTDEDEAVVDITGSTMYFTVRTEIPAGSISSDADSAVLVAKTKGSGITYSDPTNGEFEIQVDKADTNTLEIVSTGKKYEYEVAYVASGGSEPKVLARGVFKVLADIVRGI